MRFSTKLSGSHHMSKCASCITEWLSETMVSCNFWYSIVPARALTVAVVIAIYVLVL